MNADERGRPAAEFYPRKRRDAASTSNARAVSCAARGLPERANPLRGSFGGF